MHAAVLLLLLPLVVVVSKAQLEPGVTLSRSRRVADECVSQQCGSTSCSECGQGDRECRHMCWMNCKCGCYGLPAGGMGYRQWLQYLRKSKCFSNQIACSRGCRTASRECHDQCWLDLMKCRCLAQAQPSPHQQHKSKYTSCVELSRSRGCTDAFRDTWREKFTCGCMGLPGDAARPPAAVHS